MENNSINNMMRIKKTCILFFALLFAACSGIEVVEDEDGQGSEKLSTVRVFTRAASSTDKVYPLKIYAFDESGLEQAMHCVPQSFVMSGDLKGM